MPDPRLKEAIEQHQTAYADDAAKVLTEGRRLGLLKMDTGALPAGNP